MQSLVRDTLIHPQLNEPVPLLNRKGVDCSGLQGGLTRLELTGTQWELKSQESRPELRLELYLSARNQNRARIEPHLDLTST
jgi:hypothetical protein